MIRILGFTSLLFSVAIIAYRIGFEVALYHASADELLEAARLRCGYYLGTNP